MFLRGTFVFFDLVERQSCISNKFHLAFRGHVTHWECFFRERHRLTSTKVKERNLLRNELPTHCRCLQVWHCAFIECDFFFFFFFSYSIVSKERKQLEYDSEGRNVFIKKKKNESDHFIDRVFLILKILYDYINILWKNIYKNT